jgi:histidyl-tRNA synthetase
MGMGDCVLEILLREKGLLKDDMLATRTLDYYIVTAEADLGVRAVELAARIRLAGRCCDFSYKGGNLGKQLKQADAAGTKKVIILGQEYSRGGNLVIKDMQSGQQEEVGWESFLASLSKR